MGTAKAGELIFRNADNRVFQCSFDGKTYFERAHEHLGVAAMRTGDRVEVVADHKDGSGLCYARTVHVLDGQSAALTSGVRPHLRSASRPTESFAPRGDMTFAGVVLRINPNEQRTVHLRSDTRYLSAGQSLERSNLDVNTRVFIRAGKNLEDEIEAYQVVWGSILQP